MTTSNMHTHRTLNINLTMNVRLTMNVFPVKHNTNTTPKTKFKFKFLYWNTTKDSLLDPDLVNDIDDIDDETHFVNVFVKFKFKFLNWNSVKDDIDDINEINDVTRAFVNKPLPPKPPHFVMKFTFKINAMKLIENEFKPPHLVMKFKSKFNAMKLIENAFKLHNTQTRTFVNKPLPHFVNDFASNPVNDNSSKRPISYLRVKMIRVKMIRVKMIRVKMILT